MDVLPGIKKYFTLAVVFLFPLFFLPITPEYFITNKLYFLAFAVLALVVISTAEFLVTRKLVWEKHPFDTHVVLLAAASILSTLIISPNKFQAVMNPTLGVVALFSLVGLYYYVSRLKTKNHWDAPFEAVRYSALVLSVIAIVFFFGPATRLNLPVLLSFLKNPGFNTIGDQIALLAILGAVSCYSAYLVLYRKTYQIVEWVTLALTLPAIVLTLVLLYRSSAGFTNLVLPPYRISWYAAVEVLKNPLTAVFGVGVDNFSSIFTLAKDYLYNQGNLWQVGSFTASRSGMLHVMTETGLLGVAALFLLLFAVGRELLKKPSPKPVLDQAVETIHHSHAEQSHGEFALTTVFVFLVIFFVLFPPSLPVFFLLFVLVGCASQLKTHGRVQAWESDLTNIIPLYLGIPLVSFIFVLASGFFIGRYYVAEYHYKNALDGLNSVRITNVYEEMRQAVLTNPANERYHIDFSTVNMLVANRVAQKKPAEISAEDKQTISQAVQSAIAEAKAAVSLNPYKSTNWENLAGIYRNILTVAQGADVWAVSSYQRAIITDPQNPSYRLALGGVYYSLGNYQEAQKLFEQAASLKPDWANAHYNLAWASYQKADYQLAAQEMQNAIGLLNAKVDRADYERAQRDLTEFKKKLPKEETASPAENTQAPKLSLPTPPAATLEPRLKLPKTASPEAK